MKTKTFIIASIVLTFILALVSVNGHGVSATSRQTQPQVVGGFGITKVQGVDVIVHVLVEVPRNKTAQQAITRALADYGAVPLTKDHAHLGSEGFEIIGKWEEPTAVQNYNPNNQPVSDAKTALLNTYNTWNSVETSEFEINYGEDTNRCPSLVRECQGPQHLDGYNDLAWLGLRGGVLGVAWIASQDGYIVEVDVALSTRFSWSTDGVNDYDVETVMLHENGHLLGLGHSSYQEAVMYAYYTGVNRNLHWDDVEGITYLYDNDITGIVTGVVMDTEGNPIDDAVVTLVDTGLSAATDINGEYTISNVPDPVTYDVAASKSGYETQTVRVTVDGETQTNFELSTETDNDGNGDHCPPGWQRQGRC